MDVARQDLINGTRFRFSRWFMRRSILPFLTFTVFSTSLLFAQEVKPSKKVSNPQQANQQVKKLTKVDMATAYRIWSDWYKAREQGIGLPEPSLRISADAEETKRVSAIWEQARLKAHKEALQRKPSITEQAYQIWLKWYQAKQQGKDLPIPDLKISSSTNAKEAEQVRKQWIEGQLQAQREVELAESPKPQQQQSVPINNSLAAFNGRPQGIAGVISGQIANSLQSSGYKNVYTDVPRAYIEPATNPVNPTTNKITNRVDAINPATTASSAIYEHDKVGNISRITMPNGVVTSYIYNSLNRLTNIKVKKADGTVIASYDYTRGPTGNIVSVRELNGRTVNYSYDGIYRLLSEAISGSTNPNSNGTISYTYDGVGNRLQRNSLVLAVPVQQLSYDNNDRLTTDTYDDNGNTKSSGNRDYTYDVGNHITKVVESTTNLKILYLYDVDGNRVSKTVGITNNSGIYITDPVTTQYLIDEANPTGYPQVVEELQNGQVVKRYIYGKESGPIGMDQLINGQWVTSFFITDGQGSVRALTDINGNVTDTFEYDAFGVLINRTGNTPNTRLYAGEEYDPDLGFYYLRAIDI
jgi:hypothetical protein